MSIYDPIAIALGIEPNENFIHENVVPDDAELVGFGGNNKGEKRPGIGGAPKGREPWNKGLTKSDLRVALNHNKSVATKKKNGFYDTCSKYLPKLVGDKNPMRNEATRAKISARAKTRYRINREDGTWFWGFRS